MSCDQNMVSAAAQHQPRERQALNTPLRPHPPQSPDLAPCDFQLLPKVKVIRKEKGCESIQDMGQPGQRS